MLNKNLLIAAVLSLAAANAVADQNPNVAGAGTTVGGTPTGSVTTAAGQSASTLVVGGTVAVGVAVLTGVALAAGSGGGNGGTSTTGPTQTRP